MASATRTIRVRFDGSAKGLIKAAAEAGIAVEGFEKQVKKTAGSKAAQAVGTGLVSGLIDSLGSLPSVLKGAAITAAVGIGAVMAPALAGVLISGVLLAVSGGVLAAGIIGAAKSPKVQKAWQKFARQATVVFERFSKPFIGPLVSAAKYFGMALARAEPTIKRIGETMAPWVIELASATAMFVEHLMPGILTAVTAAGPFIDLLSVHLPLIADSIGGFFSAIAAGSGSAQIFFDRFLRWVEDIIPKLGGFLTWLSDLGIKMEAFSKGPEFVGLKNALTDFKDHALAGVSEGFDKIKESIEKNSETWKTMLEDIKSGIGELAPAIQYFVVSTAGSLAFIINVWAKLYNAIRDVVIIIKELIRWSDRLPGNLSGGGIHVSKGDIPGRAYGGPASAGRSYLVGEQGVPEIFTPGQSGYITPMSKAGAASNQPIIVENHIEIGGEVVRVVRTEISESNRGLRRAVLAGAGAR